MKMAAFKAAAFDRFPDWRACYPGGNAMNQSVHFREMGWDASFVGALGNDREGVLLLRALSAYGVDCCRAHILDGKTACNTLTVDELGERFEAPGAWQGGVYETYRLSESDWRHLSEMDLLVSHANHTDFEEALERKVSGQLMAVDFLHMRDYNLLVRSLGAVDIAFFGGVAEMEGPLFEIAKTHRALIVLTLGASGSVAFHGEEAYRQGALPVERVVDTTGCGDAFQAGFTDSFYRYKDVPRALSDGAALGRRTAAHRGALLWPPGMEAQARALYDR
jgi:sugar/nucleoside kinase (ribokinase family)